MKRNLLITGLAIASFSTLSFSSASVTAKDNGGAVLQQADSAHVNQKRNGTMEIITAQDLPAPVQKAWDSTKKEGDMITNVYKSNKGAKSDYTIKYKTTSGQSKSVTFDSNGKKQKS